MIIIPPRTESLNPAWCSSCQVHLALPPNHPLCPVCLATEAEKVRGGAEGEAS